MLVTSNRRTATAGLPAPSVNVNCTECGPDSICEQSMGAVQLMAETGGLFSILAGAPPSTDHAADFTKLCWSLAVPPYVMLAPAPRRIRAPSSGPVIV